MLTRERLTGRMRHRFGLRGKLRSVQVEVITEQISYEDLKSQPVPEHVTDIADWNKKQAMRIEQSWSRVDVRWRDATLKDFSTLNSQNSIFV